LEVVGGIPGFLLAGSPFLISILPIGCTGSKPGGKGISEEAAGDER